VQFLPRAPVRPSALTSDVALAMQADEQLDTPGYDRIGRGYAQLRREDPRRAALIHRALGSARTDVTVGAAGCPVPPS
jgi:hypothetical protein